MEALATSTAMAYLAALAHSDSLVLIARAAHVEAQQVILKLDSFKVFYFWRYKVFSNFVFSVF
jgi:hypothetical protein